MALKVGYGGPLSGVGSGLVGEPSFGIALLAGSGLVSAGSELSCSGSNLGGWASSSCA
jgi:mannose/fructose/N-acetylgalactosamine-specific phosphotransferase system component IID